MENWQLLEEAEINLHGKKQGSIKAQCPKCSDARKNKKEPCLSVDIDNGIYNCHHCGWHGKVFKKREKEYVKPVARLEKLNGKSLKWFENERKISNNTLLRFGITEALEYIAELKKETQVICFNYFRDEELVNIKFRGPQKTFKLAKDAELIFYNLDAIKDEKKAVIVEGEIDCLTLHECGIYNVVSVPNGASKGNQKLEYLDNCWEFFEDKEQIILMTDADEAGYSLREELARRLGKDRCLKVEYPEDCKDANDVLLKYGKDAVINTVEHAVWWPLEGIITGNELAEDVYFLYEHGYPKGATLNIPGFDELLSLMQGQLTMVTGIPGSGKSEFVDLMMIKTAIHHQWAWGICSFENLPKIHITKLAEKFTGKSFAFRRDSINRMTKEEFEKSLIFIDNYCYFVDTKNIDITMDGILEKMAELVKRKGIKGITIDPWNWIEQNKPKDVTETQFINTTLTTLVLFLEKYGLHCFLIAHPTKLSKDKQTKKYEIASLYHISGSAHFFNKTHNGISVYRDFETNTVDVYVQKIRDSWLGKLGYASFNFNIETRQYLPQNNLPKLNGMIRMPVPYKTENFDEGVEQV